MNAARPIQNLALIGFMGTGKSSIGQIVASHLQFSFLDTDHLIEHQTGRRISRIFEEDGEAAFRELECRIVKDLETHTHTVIATGGGVPAQQDNLASLKSHALVVCLWASPETIWERVKDQVHRPLLNNADPLGKIRELLHAREPSYRRADVLINTEMRSLKDVAQQVIHQFLAARSSA